MDPRRNSQPTSEGATPYMEMESTTSPWTELFQEEKQAGSAPASGGQSKTAPAPRQPETDSTRATHDALSAIFDAQ